MIKSEHVKRISILMSLAISLMAVGCGGADQQSNLTDGVDAAKEAAANMATKETGESAGTGDAVNTASEKDLDEPISYTYQNHPYSYVAGDKELAMGNIFSIELDESAKDKYPDLQKKLDELGKDYKKETLDFFTGSEQELQELIASGWFIAYELDHDYIPVRSDERVFSYSLL